MAGERIPIADLSAPDAARYALFQHMIANHDWSMRAGPVGKNCCHNAELIGPLAPGQTIPIPYDFDFSGFVGAPYATPPSELDITDVRQRLYRGYCIHNADVMAAARQMRDARPQILAVLTEVPGLDPQDSGSVRQATSAASSRISAPTRASARRCSTAASTSSASSRFRPRLPPQRSLPDASRDYSRSCSVSCPRARHIRSSRGTRTCS